MGDVTSHLDLLDRASALEQAAMADDLDSAHAELCRLRNALVDHLHTESGTLDRLGPAAAEVVRAGQERLLSSINALMDRSASEEPSCACVPRSLEVTRALARQARLEAQMLLDHQQRRPGR